MNKHFKLYCVADISGVSRCLNSYGILKTNEVIEFIHKQIRKSNVEQLIKTNPKRFTFIINEDITNKTHLAILELMIINCGVNGHCVLNIGCASTLNKNYKEDAEYALSVVKNNKNKTNLLIAPTDVNNPELTWESSHPTVSRIIYENKQ